MYIFIFRAVSSRSIYVNLTFTFQSNIDIPRYSFRAGAVVQYNDFLRMYDGTTLTHHSYDSLSLIYVASESSIFMGFHTILWSKLNIKIQQHISLVLHVVYNALLSLHKCGGFFELFGLHIHIHVSTPTTRYSVLFQTLLQSSCSSTGAVTSTITSRR